MIDTTSLDFRPILRRIKNVDHQSIHGVDWARVFVGADGEPSAIYRSGERVKTFNESPIVAFDDHHFVDVNIHDLLLTGGIATEGVRIASIVKGWRKCQQKERPFDTTRPRPRW